MDEKNTEDAKLAHLIRCLGHAETQAMRTRTEADYRSAAQYANACAKEAPYVARESYWRCADRWTRLADALATKAQEAEISI